MKQNVVFFRYLLKEIVTDKGFAFWTIVYPILMITIFYFGFSGVMNQKIEPIPVGVSPSYSFEWVFSEIDVLKPQTMSEEEGSLALKEKRIEAYVDEKGNMLVQQSGSAQTVVKEVLDSIKQITLLGDAGADFSKVSFEANYTEEINQKEDGWKMTFYSSAAMMSLYSIFAGIQVSKQDSFSSRIAVSPMKKSARISIYFVSGLLINMTSNLLLFLYIMYVLRMDLFPNFMASFLVIICGNMVGIAIGILLGTFRKLNEDAKMSFAIALTLMLSFLSGMMGRGIPRMIEKTMPFLAQLNPVARITNSLMRINVLQSTQGGVGDMLMLLVQALIILAIGFAIIRRRKYECD